MYLSNMQKKERGSMKRFSILLAVVASCLWVWLPVTHASQSGHPLDFDKNGTVDFPDFLLFVSKFGSKQGDETYQDRFDLNGDGAIDFSDFLIFVNDFGKASFDGDETVNIPDANLRAVIANSLGKSRNDVITRAEMATLTVLETPDVKIRDLTGLQHAINLEHLTLTDNPFSDLSPLCDLTNLTFLNLDNNSITDLSALSGLTNLTVLYLNQNHISDISPLSHLTNLTWLSIHSNRISDISALVNFTKLEDLDISGNKVSDISALANLTKLKFLYFWGNNFSDISALANLTNLTELNLADNEISDLTALSNLTALTRLILNNNRISCNSDLAALSGLTNLKHLDLSNNAIFDFSPLVTNTGFDPGDQIDARHNPLTDESFNTHLPALQRRGVNVQFDNHPSVSVCVAVLPDDLSVDAGTSHTLQTNVLHIARDGIKPKETHGGIRPKGTHGRVHAVAYVDFNDDGHIDFLFHPLNDTPQTMPAEVYLNDGTGCFSLDTSFFGENPPSLIHARKALTGDFNGDRRMDVFVLGSGYDHPSGTGEASYVMLSSENGYVLGNGLDTFTGYQHGGASGDIDKDGDIDVFSTHLNANLSPFFLINNGSGSFALDTTRVEGITARALYTAELVDVDGDDFLDLLAAGHEYDPFATWFRFPTQILWGDSTGVFSTSKATILPPVPGRGVVVDIDVSDTDRDGDKDIVLNRTGDESIDAWYEGYYLQLIEQVGPRRFEDKTAQLLYKNGDPDAEWIDWIRMCDCNGDGHVDIVVDDAARNLIWENDGTGTFRPR